MLFSSLEFLFLFLPVTLLCYFLVPLKARNAVLLLFSLIFYGWGERVYVWLMVFTILADYLAGLLVARAKRKSRPRAAKGWLIAAVAVNLALLGFFKYADFFKFCHLCRKVCLFFEGIFLVDNSNGRYTILFDAFNKAEFSFVQITVWFKNHNSKVNISKSAHSNLTFIRYFSCLSKGQFIIRGC